MGYPFGLKGWRLYDLENKVYFISRDVFFVEHKFPFAQIEEVPNKDTNQLRKFRNQIPLFIDDNDNIRELGSENKSTMLETIVDEECGT